MTKMTVNTPVGRREFQLRAIFAAMAACPGLGSVRANAQPGIAGAGPDEDRQKIAAVLREYLRVTDEQSQASIAASFHPAGALMSITSTGDLNAMSQTNWWARVSRPRLQPFSRTSVIRYIDVAGAAAIARIDITNAASTSTDYFTLLRLRDGWRIVNKVLSSPLD